MKRILLLFVIWVCFLPALAFAQNTVKSTEYQLLAPLPGYIETTKEDKTTAGPYIEGIFTLVIALAGGLAVVKIIFGGIKYMSTDAFSGKSEARGTIENAIWGLLLAISAWLILYTVNPNLVKFDLKIPVQEISEKPPVGGGGGECVDCQTIKNINIKTGACGNAPCSINSSVADKLSNLNNKFSFRITEAYPPTRAHDDPCHAVGTCIDATISLNSAENVKKFIAESNTAGLKATFEVFSDIRYVELTRGGVPSTNIMVNPKASGEHFHIK